MVRGRVAFWVEWSADSRLGALHSCQDHGLLSPEQVLRPRWLCCSFLTLAWGLSKGQILTEGLIEPSPSARSLLTRNGLTLGLSFTWLFVLFLTPSTSTSATFFFTFSVRSFRYFCRLLLVLWKSSEFVFIILFLTQSVTPFSKCARLFDLLWLTSDR